MLAIDFEARPSGCFDYAKFRAKIAELTGSLFQAEDAVTLLQIVKLCKQNSADVVVPNAVGAFFFEHPNETVFVVPENPRAFSVQCSKNGTYARFQRCVVTLQADNKPACKCSQYLSGSDAVMFGYHCRYAAKVCSHTLLCLIYMKLSNHEAFSPAAALDRNESKESKDAERSAALDELHRKQAEFLLNNCRLPEESSALRHKLNRMVTPGDCVFGKDCPSLGRSQYLSGKSRGANSCDHSFPTEFHVSFDCCPNVGCGLPSCFSCPLTISLFRSRSFASMSEDDGWRVIHIKICNFSGLCQRCTMPSM